MTVLNYENPDMAEMDGKCIEQMFYGNSALTSALELPACDLEQYCYDRMFSMCLKLKISSIGTNFLTMPKDIPYSAVSGMFYGTGGGNISDPESNGKYYFE